MKYSFLLLVVLLVGCATMPDPTANGRTHEELKEDGYTFIERNQNEWWAYPFVLLEGLRQASE